MKVVHVINGLGTGGAERSLAELIEPLAARGIDSVIVCLHRRAEGVEASVVAAGVDVRFVSARGLLGRVRAIRRVIREVRPDLVHTTIFESDLAGRLASARTGVPVVSSLVNTSYGLARRADPNIRRWRLAAVRLVDGLSARHLTAGFVAITEEVAAAATRDLGVDSRRVRVVMRGRNPDRFCDVMPAALELPEGSEVLLHVGRQEFQKGIDVLVGALASIRDRRPNVVLVQAGRDGAASVDIQRAIDAHGVRNAVRFLGHRDDVPELLAAADVFVFPSRYEGLGGSLLEAQASGTAIVASDLPAVREVVEAGATADLVPVDDAAALADAVVALLADDDRRAAYGKRGREVFESRFTIDRIADRFAAVLHELVSISAR